LPAHTFLYHAGTKLQDYEKLVTNGGRVITPTTLAPTIQEATMLTKSAIEQVKFGGIYYERILGMNLNRD
jgi:phosphoribosylamine-glycine ligase